VVGLGMDQAIISTVDICGISRYWQATCCRAALLENSSKQRWAAIKALLYSRAEYQPTRREKNTARYK
jgi:hypothetical protein